MGEDAFVAWVCRFAHRLRIGHWPDIENPKSFNEKIMAFKLLGRDPSFAPYIDKAEVKAIVADILGRDWVIPTLWQGTELPETRTWPVPYVLKANNSSGRNIFVRKPEEEDWQKIRRTAARWLKTPHPPLKGEWLYSQIRPQIVVEPLLGDGSLPPDYKFYVFEGRVRHIEYISARDTRYLCTMFDRNWKPVEGTVRNRENLEHVDKPENFDQLLWAAETLGSRFDFVRVDLYLIEGHPYFGELTFTPSAGVERYDPIELDYMLGSYWPWPSRPTLAYPHSVPEASTQS